MGRTRFGQLLSEMVALSEQDIEEILQEQSGTRRRFGEIALAWGLCRPEHVWRAWCKQLAESPQKIDLERVGIDAQAVAAFPRGLAVRFTMVPIRLLGDELLLAASQPPPADVCNALVAAVRLKLNFVMADSEQIVRAVQKCYL